MNTSTTLEMMKTMDYIYESIPNTYNSDKKIFIFLQMGEWQIGSSKDLRIANSAEEVYDILVKNNYDLNVLHNYVKNNLLTTAVYCNMRLEKAMKFVTDEEVTNYEENLKAFAGNIVKEVRKINMREL